MQDVQKLYYARVSGENLTPGQDILVNTIEDAYDIQEELLKMQDTSAVGFKISMTSQETQDLFQSKEPVYGPFTERQVVDGIELSNYNIPLAELELVFRVNEDISIEDGVKDILKKCTVAPAVEIPDGRYDDWFPNISKYEVVADCAVAGAIVIGEEKTVTYDQIDNITAKLSLNDKELKSGDSSEVMDHPVNAVLWFVKKLHEQNKILRAGQFVSSGTFILPIKLEVGSYKAEFEGFDPVSFDVKS